MEESPCALSDPTPPATSRIVRPGQTIAASGHNRLYRYGGLSHSGGLSESNRQLTRLASRAKATFVMRGSQPRRAPTNNPPSRPEMGRTAATDSEGTNHSSKGKRKRINNTMTIGAAKKRPRRATKADSDDESLSGPDEPQQILSDNDGADKDSVITRQYVLKSNPERSNIGNIPNGPDSSAKTKKPRWTNQEKRESPHVFRKIAQHVQSINKDLYDAVGHQWLGCAEWRKEALKVLENAEKKFCLQFSISLEAYLDPRSDPALAAHVLIVRDLPKGSSESQVRKILREYAMSVSRATVCFQSY